MCHKLILVIFVSTLLVSSVKVNSQQQPEDCGQVTIIPGDVRSLAPWTALIYFRTNENGKFEFHTTGVVLGPRTILSIAGGYFGGNFTYNETVRKYSLQQPHNVEVGVGLLSTDLDAADPNSQIAKVRYILPFRKHETGNKEFHYLIYELETALDLETPYVRAVCLNPTYLDPFRTSMVQSGFQRFPSEENNADDVVATAVLSIFNITTGTVMECEADFGEMYNRNSHTGTSSPHVFCARLKNDESCSLHGSSLVIQDDQHRWSLVGLTVLIPALRTGVCGGETTNFYSRFSVNDYDWFQNNLRCSRENRFSCGAESCIDIAHLCDSVKNCEDDSDEDEYFCTTQWVCGNDCSLKFSRIRENPSNTQNSIKIGLAKNEAPVPFCTALPVSGGVTTVCESEDGRPVNCSEAILNTRATLRCDRFFTSRYRFPSVEMKCGADGGWAPFRAFACDPDCGILTSEYQPFLQDGKPTTRTTAFPWHAAIFRLFKNEYRYFCGGSLIEQKLLLTAAHCISPVVEDQNLANQYKIVLAPISSNFSANSEDIISETYEVKRAWIPPTYNQRTLKSDIALIELATPVTFGGFIRPVCYLSRFTSTRIQSVPTVGEIGKIPGFGIDETGEVSSTLKFINLPVTSGNVCKEGDDESLSIFCGGDKNWAAAVCSGDSGGGFVFPEKRGTYTRYIIRGVVSSGYLHGARSCDPQKIATFTHIDYFGDWIVDILEEIMQ